jgi:hypothetical protein
VPVAPLVASAAATAAAAAPYPVIHVHGTGVGFWILRTGVVLLVAGALSVFVVMVRRSRRDVRAEQREGRDGRRHGDAGPRPERRAP